MVTLEQVRKEMSKSSGNGMIMVGNAVNITIKFLDMENQETKEVFDELENKSPYRLLNYDWYVKIKQRCLSTFANDKSNIIADKQNPQKMHYGKEGIDYELPRGEQ